ncbi:DUF2860 domain-containing protein [Vibrio sp. S4M6]|uniref:DUF2860 family protein n=1 Tax=Vibrio sinus TaxID=2946865 RepID=UPI002029EF5C|nr:DUF2860 family protein [Vibrio sinus]MCL9780690.1 DUF2860 domain-containing protein [Vibrio sinus]
MQKSYLQIVAASLITLSPFAHAVLAEQSGFKGIVGIGAMNQNQQSQFNTDSDNAITPSLTSKGKRTNDVEPYFYGAVTYTGSNLTNQTFIGFMPSDMEIENYDFQLGWRGEFSNSTVLTLAYVPNLGLTQKQTWADPFVTNQARQKTDEKEQAIKVQLDNIDGLPLSLKYRFGTRKLDTENSGNSQNLLQSQRDSLNRNADYHHGAVEFALPLFWKNTYIMTEVSDTLTIAKGDAMSSNEYRGRMIAGYSDKDYDFGLIGVLGHRKYDAVNPVFNQTQKDNLYNTWLFFSWKHPLDVKHVKVNTLVGYKRTNSNIEFYSASESLMTLDVSYSF